MPDAHSERMSTLRNALGLAAVLIATSSCYQEPAYAQPVYPSSATQPDQAQVGGPPGGQMDPGYGYQDPYAQQPYAQQPQQPYDPNAAQGYAQDPNAQYADPNAPAPVYDPNAPGYDPNDPNAQPADPEATAPIDDAQIDATLGAYGSFVDDDDYGQIWYPDTTVVGVDFTPYVSCGSWGWTSYGWSFVSSCGWNWGWLPFHYGRWGWFNGRWGWCRGYNWGPGWVDWRYGGGYVGWRPMMPEVRGHRSFG